MHHCITAFWNYFKENSESILQMRELDAAKRHIIMNELLSLIKNFHPGIGFKLNSRDQHGELTITAYGNPYIFKSVDLLVKFAPKIANWKIIAFIQPTQDLEPYRNGTDKPFEYHTMTFRVSAMKYTVSPCENNPLLVALNLYIPNLHVYGHSEYLDTPINILLEHLLGEKAFANEIHSVNICQLTEDVEETLQPVALYKLPEYLQAIRRLSACELN